MPAPAAPTSLTVLARGFGNPGVSPYRGDAILLASNVVAGATSYVFTADGYGEFETGGPLVNPDYTHPPEGAINFPLETNPTKGLPPTTAVTNVKVKSRNADGDSAWYDPGLTVTARSLADVTTTLSTDLATPTPTGFTCDGHVITVIYDFASTDQRECTIQALLYDDTGMTLIASTTDVAINNHGTDRTIQLTAPTLGDDYVVKMRSGGFNSSNVAVIHTSATELDPVHVPVFGLSPAAYTAAAGQAFSITMVTPDATSVLTPITVPAGTSLSPKSGDDPQIFSGTVDALGDYDCVFSIALDDSSSVVHLLLHVVTVIEAPAEIDSWKDDELLQLAVYHGAGTAANWFLTNCPPGVTTGTIAVAGPYHDTVAENVIAISGAPTASGIFEATLSVVAMIDGVPSLWSVPIRFEISGDLFLGWFHGADPEYHELQLLMRSREVKSYGAESTETLFLILDDNERLHIIVRDGPLSSTIFGRNLISDGFTDLRLVVRPVDNLDAEPYLDLGGDPVPVVIEGHTVFLLTFVVTSPAIVQAFAALNDAAGEEPLSVSLKGVGALTWIRSGRPRSSRTFPVTIVQDDEA